MKILNFTLYRNNFKENKTIGVLLLNGKFYGYTLEDAVRHNSVKIMHKTAISEGHYSLEIKYSPKYKERRVYLSNVPLFTGVQIHGGNNENDTSGCILLASSLINNGENIQGSLKNKIIEDVGNADMSFIEIINLNQF